MLSKESGLQGQIALVTGASRGIGQAIALSLAGAGATVIGTATSESGAQKISGYLSEQGYSGQGVVLQLGEAGSIESAYEMVSKEYSAPSILVNSAGITKDNLFLRMKESEWEEVIQVNLLSVLKLTKLALRPMIKARWGRIINISSVVATTGNPGQVNYSASKAAIEGMTRSLAREVGSRSVTVNCVAPGYIDTDMTSNFSDEQKKAIIDTIPLQRMGRPEDIAQAVLYIASPSADYLTGVTLPVNGGLAM